MSSGVKITGIKEIDQKLQNLKQITQHKIVGSAIYKASAPLVTAQKQIVASKTTRRTGNLDASIGRVRVPLKKAAEIGTVRVGPRMGGSYKGYHGHLIEMGTKDRYTKSGAYRGRGPSLPFIAPAFSQAMGGVEKNIYANINQIFNRWVRTGKIVAIDND